MSLIFVSVNEIMVYIVHIDIFYSPYNGSTKKKENNLEETSL